MRIVVRIVLGLSVALAMLAGVSALLRSSPTDQSAAWATVAAALAVLTSVIGSWTAQRVLELEEDRQKPNPQVRFDLSSRDGLVLLRLSNAGGSPAYNISITWNPPALTDSDGEEVHFSPFEPEIAVLVPEESLALSVGASHRFLGDEQRVYSGSIRFSDGAKREHESSFLISADHYRRALRNDTEDQITHRKLQDIPSKLDNLAKAVKSRGNG